MLSDNEEEKCQNCSTEPAEELHSCPYSEEIHDDYDLKCNCCDSCQRECLNAI